MVPAAVHIKLQRSDCYRNHFHCSAGINMIILLVFLLLLAALYATLLLLYRKSWKAIPFYHTKDSENSSEFISVVIPARNEAHNLPALIADLRLQKLTADKFEVIIVDDHSEDATAEIAEKAGGNIRLVKLADHITEPVTAFKKKALETAISFARGNVIVTTDADCRVQSEWLSIISKYFNSADCNFLVMPVAFPQSKSFFQTFQSLDFISLQGITGAALYRRWHYMCNGANLAYRRDIFWKVKGFEGIDQIASGDDMLLMEKFAAFNGDSIHYLKNEKVIVETAACKNLKTFFQQRARWAGKSAHYKNSITTAVLILIYLLNALVLVSPFIFLLRTGGTVSPGAFLAAWIAALLIKTVSELFFLAPVARFFNRVSTLKYFPLAQPFHILYTVLAGFLGMAGKQNWKGRKV